MILTFLKLLTILWLFWATGSNAQNAVSSLTLVGVSTTPHYTTKFYTKNVPMEFPSAVSFCQSYGLQLASILEVEDQAVITKAVSDPSISSDYLVFWLGGFKTAAEGVWRWNSTGALVPLPGTPQPNYWVTGEPYSNPGINCMVVNLQGPYKEKWTQYYCTEKGFIRPLCENRVPFVDVMFSPLTPYMPTASCAEQAGDTASPIPSLTSDLTTIGTSDSGGRKKQFFSKNVQMNWASAVDFCSSKGLRLASVESDADQKAITNWASDATRANDWGFFWLSGSDLAVEGEWRWLESGNLVPLPGKAGSYWIGGEPTVDRNVNCLHVNLGWYKGGWTQHYCTTAIMRPLCMSRISECGPTCPEKVGDTFGPADTSGLTLVGNAATSERSKDFYSKNEQMNWTMALNFCSSRGLKLASVESPQDQKVITDWAADSNRANEWSFFWLSGNDIEVEGTWRWQESGNLVPLPGKGGGYWIGGEPTIAQEANCLHANLGWYKGGWGQHLCSTSIMRPLCMRRTSTCGQATTPNPGATTVAPSTPTPTCSCGQRTSQKIIGGLPATVGEFPWRCLVFFPGSQCTCTIISRNWVMTAGHCTHPFRQGTFIVVDAGDVDTRTNSESANVFVRVDRFVEHPAYTPPPPEGAGIISNDISLLHLQTPLNFSGVIQPACLPFKMIGRNYVGSPALISGWGVDVSGGSFSSPILKKADTTIIDKNECAKQYGPMYKDANILCTAAAGKSTCNGDSGGGLDYVGANGRTYAIGVTSFGAVLCPGGYPNAFERVDTHLDWIQFTTGEQFCIP